MSHNMLAHLHTFVSILRRNDTCSNATFAKSNRLESQAIPNNELLTKLPIWVESGIGFALRCCRRGHGSVGACGSDRQMH